MAEYSAHERLQGFLDTHSAGLQSVTLDGRAVDQLVAEWQTLAHRLEALSEAHTYQGGLNATLHGHLLDLLDAVTPIIDGEEPTRQDWILALAEVAGIRAIYRPARGARA
jgi:hypothetical protein